MTVLADTSVWIDHFRRKNQQFIEFLREGVVLIHPFISGELACGNLENRSGTLLDLSALPSAVVVTQDEALRFISARRLWGRGLGWVDIHLLASALLSSCRFWTLDKRLAAAAAELDLS